MSKEKDKKRQKEASQYTDILIGQPETHISLIIIILNQHIVRVMKCINSMQSAGERHVLHKTGQINGQTLNGAFIGPWNFKGSLSIWLGDPFGHVFTN